MICNTYVQFFRTLADPTKLSIINLLKSKPCCVLDICAELKMEQSRVSHNLRKLRDLGFVTVSPRGKERVYALDKQAIRPLLDLIQKHVDTYYHKYCTCKGTAKQKRWKK